MAAPAEIEDADELTVGDVPQLQTAPVGMRRGRDEPVTFGTECEVLDGGIAGSAGPGRARVPTAGPTGCHLPRPAIDAGTRSVPSDATATIVPAGSMATAWAPSARPLSSISAARLGVPDDPFADDLHPPLEVTHGGDQPAAVGTERQAVDRETMTAQGRLLEVAKPPAVIPFPAAAIRRALVQERLGQGHVVRGPLEWARFTRLI